MAILRGLFVFATAVLITSLDAQVNKQAATLKTFLRNLIKSHPTTYHPFNKLPIPNRPFPIIDSSPYLIINISWPISSGGSQSYDKLRRGEIDTAIMYDMLTFGPGCQNTFASSLVHFSGDDVYAPGYEAYMFALPPPAISKKIALPETVHTSTADDRDVYIYATHKVGFTFKDVVVRAELYDTSHKLLSSQSITLKKLPPMTGFCSTSGQPVARLRLTRLKNVIIYAEDISEPKTDDHNLRYPNEEPTVDVTPSFEPTASYEVTATAAATAKAEIPMVENISTPHPFPLAHHSVTLRVNITWFSEETDAETAIHVPILDPNLTTVCMMPEYETNFTLFTSGNNYLRNGSEWYAIDLEKLRASGRWTSPSFSIDIYADWFQRKDINGYAFLTSTIIAPGGEIIFESRRVYDMALETTFSCLPKTHVATLTVYICEQFGEFHIYDLHRIGAPKEKEIEVPHISTETVGLESPDVTKDPVLLHAWDEVGKLYTSEPVTPQMGDNLPDASTMVQPSAEPSLAPTTTPTAEETMEPSIRPSPQPTMNALTDYTMATPEWSKDNGVSDGKLLVVTFSWPSGEDELVSQVRFNSMYGGAGCENQPIGNDVISLTGNGSTNSGVEKYIIKIGEAQASGNWLNMVDVDLGAHWFDNQEYSYGIATVKAELRDEDNVTLVEKLECFNPYSPSSFSAPFDAVDSCLKHKIGRVTVFTWNGTMAMGLSIY